MAGPEQGTAVLVGRNVDAWIRRRRDKTPSSRWAGTGGAVRGGQLATAGGMPVGPPDKVKTDAGDAFIIANDARTPPAGLSLGGGRR